MRVIKTENPYEIATDKSCILLSGTLDEDSTVLVGPITVKTHAVHVLRNPDLGAFSLQIITPDDGAVDLNKIPKNKMDVALGAEWHYKVFIVRVDLPHLA